LPGVWERRHIGRVGLGKKAQKGGDSSRCVVISCPPFCHTYVLRANVAIFFLVLGVVDAVEVALGVIVNDLGGEAVRLVSLVSLPPLVPLLPRSVAPPPRAGCPLRVHLLPCVEDHVFQHVSAQLGLREHQQPRQLGLTVLAGGLAQVQQELSVRPLHPRGPIKPDVSEPVRAEIAEQGGVHRRPRWRWPNAC
jgi:hypothetical protein